MAWPTPHLHGHPIPATPTLAPRQKTASGLGAIRTAQQQRSTTIWGALPYDTYEIEELPCKENEGTILAHFTITISRDNTTLDLGTVDNDTIPLSISGEVDKRETFLNEAGSFDYTIDYRSTSSTWVDEFTMTDAITCAEDGYAHLTGIATPVSFEDYDGMMNVWYRTNFDQEKEQEKAASEEDGKMDKTGGNSAARKSKSKSDGIGEDSSEASSGSDEQPNACTGNPYNPDNPTNKRIHDFSGWRIWKQDVSTLESQELAVNDLSLEQGEFVIAVAFEHGRVEEGFGTNAQDAKEWERPERYENVDLSDLPANRASFNLKEAAGPTRSEEDSIIAYAPAILHMQATEETLSGDAVDLWNVANIDTHRNLELHDEDRDSVVQSTNPVETAVESVAAKLPKTNDGSAPVPLLVRFSPSNRLRAPGIPQTVTTTRIKASNPEQPIATYPPYWRRGSIFHLICGF